MSLGLLLLLARDHGSFRTYLGGGRLIHPTVCNLNWTCLVFFGFFNLLSHKRSKEGPAPPSYCNVGILTARYFTFNVRNHERREAQTSLQGRGEEGLLHP